MVEQTIVLLEIQYSTLVVIVVIVISKRFLKRLPGYDREL
jgi:hypothetical protein